MLNLKNFSSKKQVRLFLFLLIASITINKLIFILFPRPIDSFVANYLVHFYNTKAFIINPHSFYDYNFPGTPTYIITSLLINISTYFIGIRENILEEYIHYKIIVDSFLYTSIILSIIYFINFFKKKLNILILFSFIMFYFSLYQFFFLLEIIEATVFLVPCVFLIITLHFKFIEKNNKVYKYSFVLSLGLFSKLTLLPFVAALLFTRIYFLIKEKNFLTLIKLTLSFLFFTILLNLPILGRLPGIIYRVIFTRGDINLDFSFSNIIESIFIYQSQSPLIFTLMFISVIYFIMNLRFKKINKITSEKESFILCFFFLFFFVWTFIIASKEIALYYNFQINFDDEHLFRNNFFYIFYIFFILYYLKNNQTLLKLSKYIFLICAINFLSINYQYLQDRSNKIQNFYNESKEIKKIINIEKILTQTAFFGCQLPDFAGAMPHFVANTVFTDNRFENQLNKSYSDFNFFNLLNILYENKINESFVNKDLLKIDKILLKVFSENSFVFNSLSPTSYNRFNNRLGSSKRDYLKIFSPNIEKSKISNLFICTTPFKTKENYKHIDNEIIKKINNKFNISKVKKIKYRKLDFILLELKN